MVHGESPRRNEQPNLTSAMPQRARRLLAFLDGPLRRRMWLIAAAMIISAALEGASVGLVPPFLALVLRPEAAEKMGVFAWMYRATGAPGHELFLAYACLCLLLLYLLKNAFLAFSTYIQYRFVYDGYAGLSTRLLESYLRAPYVFHLRRNPAELLRNVTSESSFVFCQVLMPTLVILTEGLIVLAVIGLLVVWEPRGAIFSAVVLGGPSLFFYRKLKGRISELGLRQQRQSEDMFRQVSQSLAGAKESKVLGREAFFIDSYERSVGKFSNAVSFYQAALQYPRLMIEILAVLGFLLIVVASLLRGRPATETLPVLGLVAAASFRLMPSIARIVGAATTIRYYVPSVDLLHADLEMLKVVRGERVSGATAGVMRDGIVLEDVVYRYSDTESPVLRGVSLTIPQGASVAITGSSGAGKSTLADVILGLLKPEAGRILADGRDIHSDLNSWQRRIGYVPQSVYLYDDTVRRNVAFGVADSDRDESRVLSALEAAQMKDFVAGLPQGLDTEIGERGVRLSGGQRQRLGIARALYHDPEILIMDEATSALDDSTESAVNLAIRRLAGKKTLLVIAHRASTVEQCAMRIHVDLGGVTAMATA